MDLTPGRICCEKEAPIAINETSKKHKLCLNKGSYVTTLIIATWESLLRQKNSFKEISLLRQGNVCRDTEIRSTCRDKVMYVATRRKKKSGCER